MYIYIYTRVSYPHMGIIVSRACCRDCMLATPNWMKYCSKVRDQSTSREWSHTLRLLPWLSLVKCLTFRDLMRLRARARARRCALPHACLCTCARTSQCNVHMVCGVKSQMDVKLSKKAEMAPTNGHSSAENCMGIF